jgi:hypothetical protein
LASLRLGVSLFIAKTPRRQDAERIGRRSGVGVTVTALEFGECGAEIFVMTRLPPNQGAAANRRPALPSDGSGDLSAIVAAARAFPAAVAELGR